MNEEQQGLRSEFIGKAVAVGFTDDQADFMWDYIMESVALIANMREE